MSSLWKTPSYTATEVAPAATAQNTQEDTATSPLDQQKKNKKKYGFVATQGVLNDKDTFGV